MRQNRKLINNGTLHIKIIELPDNRLMDILNKIKAKYQFQLDEGDSIKNFEEFKEFIEKLKLTKNPPPFLFFINISSQTIETIRPILKRLSDRKFTWVFLLCDKFNSEIAAEVWLNYPCVVGYEVITHLNPQDIERLIGELVRILSSETTSSDDLVEIGSIFPLSEEEYSRRKYVSLFIGGPRELLIEIRHILETIRQYNPPPKDLNEHPFKKYAPSSLFDEVVKAVQNKNKLPDWLEKLGKNRKSFSVPNVLILGETGTGKTLLARLIHYQNYLGLSTTEESCEESWDFVDTLFQDLNCSAIPRELVDNELFGHVAGSYTSAHKNNPGKIFCSCYGTLFLDEIGDMPLQAQAKLLKFLDDGGFYPLGWSGPKIYIPTTVIAATNQPIERLLEEGRLRRDLYERFRFKIRLPSLRERMEHFDALVDFVLQNPAYNKKDNKGERKVKYISREALNLLRSYDYPGNFRELESILWMAISNAISEASEVILPRHIRLPRTT